MRGPVLHVYSGNLFGGIERFLETLAAVPPAAAGARHEFALCFEGKLKADLEASGHKVHDLGARHGVRFSKPWTVMRARRKLRAAIHASGARAVVFHSVWPYVALSGAARASEAEEILYLHDALAPSHWLDRLAALKAPKHVICNSEYTASTATPRIPGARIDVIPYPVSAPASRVPDERRRGIRRGLGAGDGEVVIIQASRMQAWKGHELHLEALGRLKEVPGWVCWIAGGPQRPQEERYLSDLKAQAAKLGITDRVRFLGQRSDIPELLQAADIHCQPNAAPEPFGIAFVEALYAGLPVVSVDMGGAREILTPECGILCAGDPAAIAEALRSLIESKDKRARLGSAGPARARELCEPAMVAGRLTRLLEPSGRS